MRLLLTAALVGLAGLAPAATAQQADRQQAEQRLQALRNQIEAFERELSAAQAEEQDATAALDRLDREIAVREALIASYQQRLESLGREAAAIEAQRLGLQAELEALQDEYRGYARSAYMRGRMGDLALILSAGSINQMLARARYLQRFTARRESKLDAVRSTREALSEREAALDSAAVETQALLAESRSEQAELAGRKRERAGLVTQLRRRRSAIEAELQQRQDDQNRLVAQIQAFIAAEEAARRAEAERRRAAAATAASPARPAPAPDVAEAELVRLSGSFRQNRGKLPWPASGVVTGTFGLRTHPVYGTKTRSIGIEISTPPTAPVRAVFGGAVSRIFRMPGYGTCVMVTHGDYATVYGNLSTVGVQQGQRVEPGQALGRGGTPSDPLGAGVFFALFADGEAVDPAAWLRPR
ncbi:MAG: peptidoglycan DD-metalloendopeptidase family protein [Rhodothermales bacterium]|nr:peptidoglycan DD-metalloendopeptidase family protein [Rhodothermales bacterium]